MKRRKKWQGEQFSPQSTVKQRENIIPNIFNKFINDCIDKRIVEKFKKYDTPYPKELLMYINIYPIPTSILTKNLHEYLETQPRPFSFRNIWIFDCRNNEIMLHCNDFGIDNKDLIYHY